MAEIPAERFPFLRAVCSQPLFFCLSSLYPRSRSTSVKSYPAQRIWPRLRLWWCRWRRDAERRRSKRPGPIRYLNCPPSTTWLRLPSALILRRNVWGPSRRTARLFNGARTKINSIANAVETRSHRDAPQRIDPNIQSYPIVNSIFRGMM